MIIDYVQGARVDVVVGGKGDTNMLVELTPMPRLGAGLESGPWDDGV